MNEGSDYLLWYYVFQEKAKKILDIWTKSTTFPPAVLTRLENVLEGDDAPGAYLVPILCSLSIPLLCNPKLCFRFTLFGK
jgi:hypothetical protein